MTEPTCDCCRELDDDDDYGPFDPNDPNHVAMVDMLKAALERRRSRD